MKLWFRASGVAAAPHEDLLLLETLRSYPDRTLADAASKKLRNHLWYLSKEMLPLAFFDDSVCGTTKTSIVKAMREKQGGDHFPKKAQIPADSQVQLRDLASFSCCRFFEKTKISTAFFRLDPLHW